MTDINRLQQILITVEEYFNCKEFLSCIAQCKPKEYGKDYTDELLLMMLRKYIAPRSDVRFDVIFSLMRGSGKIEEKEILQLQKEWESIKNSEITISINDGTEINLINAITNELYGIFLHANEDRILQLLNTNEELSMFIVKKFVSKVENLLIRTKECLEKEGIKLLQRKEPIRASIIHYNDIETEKKISNSPYWSNIKGRDINENDRDALWRELDEESFFIIVLVALFTEELSKPNYDKSILRKMVHKRTIRAWGDFSSAHEEIVKMKQMAFSMRVRYNEGQDMAYVYLFENVVDGLVIQGSQMISEVRVITLARQHKNKQDWKIYSLGGRTGGQFT